MTVSAKETEALSPPLRPADAAERDAIAEAVHRAALDLAGPERVAHSCHYYAFAGALACAWATGRRYIPCVGGFDILCRPPDEMFFVDGSNGGLLRGEYHAWVMAFDGRGEPAAFADFSSRHYRTLYEKLLIVEDEVTADGRPVITTSAAARPPWTAPEPPPYFWEEGATPDGIYFHPDELSTVLLANQFREDVVTYGKLRAATLHHLRALIPGFTCRAVQPVVQARNPRGEMA